MRSLSSEVDIEVFQNDHKDTMNKSPDVGLSSHSFVEAIDNFFNDSLN